MKKETKKSILAFLGGMILGIGGFAP